MGIPVCMRRTMTGFTVAVVGVALGYFVLGIRLIRLITTGFGVQLKPQSGAGLSMNVFGAERSEV